MAMTDDDLGLDDELFLGFDGEPVTDVDAVKELTTDEALAEVRSRGPGWAALVDELNVTRAERAAAEAARLAFITAEQEASVADEFAETILGSTIAQDLAQALAEVDDATFEKNRRAVYAAGARERGWGDDGPLGSLDPRGVAMVAQSNAERVTDPTLLLSKVVADRAGRVEAALIRNPGLAELHGKVWNARTRSIEDVQPATHDAGRLTGDEFSSLLRAAKGEVVRPPAGHTAESWRSIVAAFVGGTR